MHIFPSEDREHRWLGLERKRVYKGYGPREEYWLKESLERSDAFSKEAAVTAFSS